MGTFQAREYQFQAEQFTGPQSIPALVALYRPGTVTVTYQAFMFDEGNTLTLKATDGPDVVLHEGDWLVHDTEPMPFFRVVPNDKFQKLYRHTPPAQLGHGFVIYGGGGAGGGGSTYTKCNNP